MMLSLLSVGIRLQTFQGHPMHTDQGWNRNAAPVDHDFMKGDKLNYDGRSTFEIIEPGLHAVIVAQQEASA